MGKIVPIDTRRGEIAELCWLALSPDDRFLYAAVFGYSDVTSFELDGLDIRVAKDPACPEIEGDGTFRALCGDISSGPSDNWLSPDGAYLYQIYGNASKLVGYATKPDGALEEVTGVAIAYNSPRGIGGILIPLNRDVLEFEERRRCRSNRKVCHREGRTSKGVRYLDQVGRSINGDYLTRLFRSTQRGRCKATTRAVPHY